MARATPGVSSNRIEKYIALKKLYGGKIVALMCPYCLSLFQDITPLLAVHKKCPTFECVGNDLDCLIPLDDQIAPYIQRLWMGGIPTQFCCAGHAYFPTSPQPKLPLPSRGQPVYPYVTLLFESPEKAYQFLHIFERYNKFFASPEPEPTIDKLQIFRMEQVCRLTIGPSYREGPRESRDEFLSVCTEFYSFLEHICDRLHPEDIF